MYRFLKNVLKVALGLASAMVLVIPLQARTVAGDVKKPRAFLLAQNAKEQKGQQKSHAPANGKEEDKLQQEKSKDQNMQMEKQAPKTRAIQEPPAAAGTKKIGGQIIREKESHDRE